MASSVWYRIAGKKRDTKEKALPSLKGRFHDDPGGEPTSYVGDSLLTVWKETLSARAWLTHPNPEEYRGWRVTLKETKLIDFRKREVREAWKVAEEELTADPAPVRCKEVARAVRRSGKGYRGMLYRSVRNKPEGVCVVLFLEHLGAEIEVAPVPEKEWRAFLKTLEATR